MALINTGPDYTRSGDNFLTRWANRASFIPWVGGWIAGGLGMAGAIVDSAGWLFRGKFLSAATVLATGAVSSAINGATGGGLSNPLYWGNVASGVASGSSLGTHGRAATEAVIGAVTGALGVRPTVLRSYTAGVGNINSGAMNAPSRSFTNRLANERGQDANQLWNQKMNGEAGAYVSPSLTGQRGMA